MRILDAALNRAGEGLRVIEDFARFLLDDACLTQLTKQLRHDLTAVAGSFPSAHRHAARDSAGDIGTAISVESEAQRADAWDVCAASFKRTQQSLRSLEEYGKILDPDIAGKVEALRYRLYTLEKAIDIGRTSREQLHGVRLCVLVDGQQSPARFERLVQSLVEAGVGMIQLRDKRLDDRELIGRARMLVSLSRGQPAALLRAATAFDAAREKRPTGPGADRCAERGTLAVINDRADIAAVVRADGVHLGQDDLPVQEARGVVGPRMLIGVSTHNIEQARAAVLAGANYLGAGPTFRSQTKAFDEFAGLAYLRAVSAEIRLPTFAIGGITTENLPDVLATGITRVALSSTVTAAQDPGAAARELLSMLDNKRGIRTAAAEAASPPQSPVSSP